MIRNNILTVGIYTLGCKVNQYESEAIAEALADKGFSVVPPEGICDAYVINTCTVTAESDRKCRQFIRRAISKNPNAYVLVAGCFSQTSPNSVANIDGVDVVLGNTEKLCVVDRLIELAERNEKNSSPSIAVKDITTADFEKMSIRKFDRTRAYVKIEDGCESNCTYCIIPSARGKIRSKSPEEIIEEVKLLTNNGCKEIVLTGIETAAYGRDLENVDLGDILCRIDDIPNIGRVRLGSLDPSLIRPAFVKKIAQLKSLAPHFHLSLQSGSDRILALMKRKYNSEMAMSAIDLLRQHIANVKFTTDIIVGFPYEDEGDFEDTATFLQKAKFLSTHIFPYSKRKGTPAAEMPCQIPADVKSARLHRLEQISAEVRQKILENEVATRPHRQVLFETYDGKLNYGHTDDFLEIAVPSETDLRGSLANVTLISTDGSQCLGVLQ